ncbi:hypothetical protein ACWDTD_08100 [Gordonia sp. NPDC003425]
MPSGRRDTGAVAGWRGILTERRGGPLPPRRAASRLSAYVYGNILVLAAVVAVSPHDLESGHAFWIVIGTGATTYVAHVFADLVAQGSIPEAHGGSHDSAPTNADRDHVLGELRDAVPIVSSAAAVVALKVAFGH